MKILIADDEIETTQALKLMLERKGHEVTAFYDGSRALNSLKAVAYDVAFVDHNMPELTGLEIAQYVKAHDLPVKVVMITGDPGMKDILALPLGASDYITKPFTKEDIEKVIKKYTK